MGEATRLDQISSFGDKIRYLIPHDWVEGDDEGEGTCLFHAPDADSGWFRVSLITLKTVETSEKRLLEIVSKDQHLVRDEETGNYVASWEEDSEQEGARIHLSTGR